MGKGSIYRPSDKRKMDATFDSIFKPMEICNGCGKRTTEVVHDISKVDVCHCLECITAGKDKV